LPVITCVYGAEQVVAGRVFTRFPLSAFYVGLSLSVASTTIIGEINVAIMTIRSTGLLHV